MKIKITPKLKNLIKDYFSGVITDNFKIPDTINGTCEVDNFTFRVTPIGCGNRISIILSVTVRQNVDDKYYIEYKAQINLNDKYNIDEFYGWSISLFERISQTYDYEKVSIKFDIDKLTYDKKVEIDKLVKNLIVELNKIKVEKEII